MKTLNHYIGKLLKISRGKEGLFVALVRNAVTEEELKLLQKEIGEALEALAIK